MKSLYNSRLIIIQYVYYDQLRTQADPSSSGEVFKRVLADYETNSTCTSASIDKNNNRVFLDSVSKLNLIFLGKSGQNHAYSSKWACYILHC